MYLGQCLSLVFAIALPSVSTSLYFHTNNNTGVASNVKVIYSVEHMGDELTIPTNTSNTSNSPKFAWKNAFQLIWLQFRTSYANKSIIQWSLWWTLGTCGIFQVCITIDLKKIYI